MQRIIYYYAKFLKKIRGKAIIKSKIHKTSTIESGSHIVEVILGKHSFCGYDCEIINCSIGAFCSIANNVIIGGAMHPINWVSMSPVFYAGRDSVSAKFSTHLREPDKKITIGHDVWIGHSVLIKQGLNIGTGAVIGMGSVVTKDVPPYEIWAGNPAKMIKKRFDDDTITILLKIKWWDKDDTVIKLMADSFNNIDEFIKKFNK